MPRSISERPQLGLAAESITLGVERSASHRELCARFGARRGSGLVASSQLEMVRSILDELVAQLELAAPQLCHLAGSPAGRARVSLSPRKRLAIRWLDDPARGCDAMPPRRGAAL